MICSSLAAIRDRFLVALAGKYNPDQPRDEQGRWVSAAGKIDRIEIYRLGSLDSYGRSSEKPKVILPVKRMKAEDGDAEAFAVILPEQLQQEPSK